MKNDAVRAAARRLARGVRRHARRWRSASIEEIKDTLTKLHSALLSATLRKTTSVRRILMIDDLVPDPLFGAGYPRAFAIVHALVEAGYQVSFYPMAATQADLSRVQAMFAGAVGFHPAEGARGLRRLLWREGAGFDAILISRPTPMRAFVDLCWRPPRHMSTPPIIYDAEAVVAPREARRRRLFGPGWLDEDYQAALATEFDLARGVKAVTATGRPDADLVRSVLDLPVFVLGHPVVGRVDAPSFAGRRDFLFVGRLSGPASYSPNVDSILWFATQVMPALDTLIGGGYRIHIAGLMEAPEVEALASDRVVLHGVVEDLRPLYESCRVFVAPTRYAAGIPLKVLEAMGEGIPCVVTPLLAEQIEASPEALAIGDGAMGFAAQCGRLYTDPVAWKATQHGGLAHIDRRNAPSAFKRALMEVLHHVATAIEPPPPADRNGA